MRPLLLILAGALLAQAQVPAPTAPAAAPRRGPIYHRVAAGDLDGDGLDDAVTYNGETKRLAVITYREGAARELTATTLENFPCRFAIADLDGDGKAELVIGEGLKGYNPKDGPQTDAILRIYRPLGPQGWKPEEIYRQASERPEVTSLEVVDTDGDGKPEILFAYFASKYGVHPRLARRRDGAWKIEELPEIRMGMTVAAGDVGGGKTGIAVGRPYGDGIGILGDAFLLRGTDRIPLPAFRGVSSLLVGRIRPGDAPTVIMGDGWHQDFGKIARSRLAIMQLVDGKWRYELIEDVPEHTRIVELQLTDLDGDGAREIVARGERRSSLGGDVRVYQRTASGWRGATIAANVQDFAIGRFHSRAPELLAALAPAPVALDLKSLKWDAKLAEAVETFEVDPNSLIGKPAPRVDATDWVGSQPLTLDQLKGKVVLLDFWATWCKPCLAQFPKMREMAKSLGPRGLVILGVTDLSSQTREVIDTFLQKEKLPWPIAIDPSKRTSMYYGVGPIPHSVLVDREGVIRMVHVGSSGLDEVERAIEPLLAK